MDKNTMQFVWEQRVKNIHVGSMMYAEGHTKCHLADKLRKKCAELRKHNDSSWTNGNIRHSEIKKLQADGYVLITLGKQLIKTNERFWNDCVMQHCGDTNVLWLANGNCVLPTGEEFININP